MICMYVLLKLHLNAQVSHSTKPWKLLWQVIHRRSQPQSCISELQHALWPWYFCIVWLCVIKIRCAANHAATHHDQHLRIASCPQTSAKDFMCSDLRLTDARPH